MKITCEIENDAALDEVDALMDRRLEEGSPEAQRFLELVEAIEEFEAIHYPIPTPTPEEAARFRREQEEDSE